MTRVKQIISTLLIIAILGGLAAYGIDKRNRVENYILEGKQAFESGDYVSSLTNFNQAVQLDGDNVEALEGRLFALLGIQNFQAVRGVCMALKRENPKKYKMACRTAMQGEFPWYIYKPLNKDFVGEYRWVEEYKTILTNPNVRVKKDPLFHAGVVGGQFSKSQNFNRYFLCDLDNNGIPELFLVADSPSGKPQEKTVFMHAFSVDKRGAKVIKNIEYIYPGKSRLIGCGNLEDSANSYTTFKIVHSPKRGLMVSKKDTTPQQIERATPIGEVETFAINDLTPIDEYVQSLSSKRFM